MKTLIDVTAIAIESLALITIIVIPAWVYDRIMRRRAGIIGTGHDEYWWDDDQDYLDEIGIEHTQPDWEPTWADALNGYGHPEQDRWLNAYFGIGLTEVDFRDGYSGYVLHHFFNEVPRELLEDMRLQSEVERLVNHNQD